MESEKEATKYTKAANRKKLAAMALTERQNRNEIEQTAEIDCPTAIVPLSKTV
jgi:hypothetical protein